jgi:hypothetical protein
VISGKETRFLGLGGSDRLRLAAMILNDISHQNIAVVDESNITINLSDEIT